jgi:hypothetical protein
MWFLLQGAIILAIAGPIIEWVGEDYKRPAVKLGFIVAYGVTVGLNVAAENRTTSASATGG